jgi:hypothetical protein
MLAPTGLLMEGDYIQALVNSHVARKGQFQSSK